MSRGGYRPGAGRKKGQKNTKPRKGTEAKAEEEKLKAMVALAKKAKEKIHREFLIRIANNDGEQAPLSLAEKKEFLRLSAEMEAEAKPAEIADKLDRVSGGLEAGEFLRQVWNDPSVEISLRIRAAEISFRVAAEKLGKKDEKNEAARRAGQGKFQAGRPPFAVVK